MINDYKKEIKYLISLKLKFESLREDFHYDSSDAFEAKDYSGYQAEPKDVYRIRIKAKLDGQPVEVESDGVFAIVDCNKS